MEGFRSKSHKNTNLQIEPYYGGGGTNPNPNQNPITMKDLRSFSANYSYSSNGIDDDEDHNKEMKMKKWKSSRVGSASKKWNMGLSLMSDPELQRKKRVAGYKVYSVEGNIKGSFRKSLKWIKTHVVHGWW